MTDGYVDRRRQYVAQIRNSFDSPEQKELPYEEPKEVGESSFSFQKLQFLAAAGILILFLFMKLNGLEFYGYQAQEIIEIISDNHYYTNLQDYVTVDEEIPVK